MGYAPVSTIDTPPSPANSGTTLSVQQDSGDRYPVVPFTALVFPTQTIPDRGVDSEEVTVTNRDGDDFVITRADDPVDIEAGMQISALKPIPVYRWGQTVDFSATFPSADAPYKLTLRSPEGGTVILNATDEGSGVATVSYDMEVGGVWWERWQSLGSFLDERSFFVDFSEVKP